LVASAGAGSVAAPPPAICDDAAMSTLPIGPEIDATPRPLPARIPLRGSYAVLEPLHVRHTTDLWRAAQGAEDSWRYMSYGPFPSEAALGKFIGDFCTAHESVAWAVRPVATGQVSGWLTLMNIEPKHAAVELGNIWFGPPMQRTRAATEAMYLPLKYAAGDLGYRRLVWKCDCLNAPSRRAAARLGFTYEGRHRAHLTVKGRQRETDWFSIIAPEWPSRRDALAAWLAPENFAPDGTARRGLAELRGD
jgi:RimJ/RimL family protein N-acetyltransferase